MKQRLVAHAMNRGSEPARSIQDRGALPRHVYTTNDTGTCVQHYSRGQSNETTLRDSVVRICLDVSPLSPFFIGLRKPASLLLG